MGHDHSYHEVYGQGHRSRPDFKSQGERSRNAVGGTSILNRGQFSSVAYACLCMQDNELSEIYGT